MFCGVDPGFRPATAGAFFGNVGINGNLQVSGQRSAVVPFPDGSRRALYCMGGLVRGFRQRQASTRSRRRKARCTLCSRWSPRRTCHVEQPLPQPFLRLCRRVASDLLCGDRLFSFVMRERLHRIAIIGMLVTAVLGASLATRDLIHHSNPPHSSITH